VNPAAALLHEAAGRGLRLTVPGPDRLRVEGDAPPEFLDRLRTNKAELLALLAGVDPDLAARARSRMREVCHRLSLDPAPILRQFDSWVYPAADLRELLRWPDETVAQHVRALAQELKRGIRP
jgi:hypothetical protein